MSLWRDVVYLIAGIVSSPVWAYRLLRTGKWRTDWPGRFGYCDRDGAMPKHAGATLLIHTVSVGEVNAVRMLVDELHDRRPDLRLVISVTTDTGIARAQALFSGRGAVVRYPLDFTRCVRRFLDTVQPSVVALTELEVWPNFVDLCHRRGIPVCVINGRLSARSLGRYKLIAPLLRPTFAKLAAAAVQTDAYAHRFAALGVPADRLHILDTMKWDTAHIADEVAGAAELAAVLGIDRTRPVIVAGSTGPGEEQLLLDVVPEDAQLIIVPRKPERFEEVARLDPNFVRRSQSRDPRPETRDPRPARFLLDTMGELRQAYALADLVIVGRSFNRLGGSDPIEPVALGKPAIIGPDHHHFADAVAALQAGGGIEVIAAEQLRSTIESLLTDKPRAAQLARKGREVILSRQGATKRHAEVILKLLGKRTA